nr:ATP-binding cassette domain-containing protein [Coprococcus comes]
MDEIFNIPVLKDTQISKTFDNDNVTFDNVSFSYTGKENELAIKNVSFEAKQGEITAIVGLSGGGKSTIANLISRFWDVTSGSIKIGNVDVREVGTNDLMKHISFV